MCGLTKMGTPRDWEEALNEVVDEKQELLDMLAEVVTTWYQEPPLHVMENAMGRAKGLLDKEANKIMRD